MTDMEPHDDPAWMQGLIQQDYCLSERQKKMLFCIEGLRNRDKKLIEQDLVQDKFPFAEELFKLFCEEHGQRDFYNMCKDRTGIKID